MRRMILVGGLVAAIAGTAMAQKLKNPQPNTPQTAPQAVPAPPPRDEPVELQRLRRLLGAGATLTYAQATRDGAALRLAGVTLRHTGLLLRATELRLEGVREDGVDLLTARGVTSEGFDAATLELRGLGLTAGAVRLANASATGITVTATTPMTIERATLDRVQPGQPSTLEAINWRLQPGGGAMALTLRRMALTSPDGAALVSYLAGAPSASIPTLNGEAEGFEVRDGTERLGGIERLRVVNGTAPGGVATGRLTITGAEVLARGAMAPLLQPLGYQVLRAELTLDATQDEARGRSEITALALGVREAGAIGLAVAVDGILRQGDMAGRTEQARLVSARLRFADQSLYRRVLEAQATQRRVTPEALRREWVQQAEMLLSGPQLAAIRLPVQRFLRSEAREIELVAAPPRPVGREVLAQPPADFAGWQRLLGLTITAR